MQYPIDELIPQKSPFLFVDKVLVYSNKSIETTYLITKDNPLVEGFQLSEAGLIENMAQTAAALEGCRAKQNNQAIKTGFIGAVKKLEITGTADISDLLETKISIINNVMGATVAEGVVRCKEKILAKCELTIFLKQ